MKNSLSCRRIWRLAHKPVRLYPGPVVAESCVGADRVKESVGGLRVIYFLRLTHGQIVLVLLYGKNVRENVSPTLLQDLRKAFDHEQEER